MPTRFTQKEFEELLEKFNQSKLSMNKFSRLHNIPRSTFHRYFSKYKDKKAETISVNLSEDLSTQINALTKHHDHFNEQANILLKISNRLEKAELLNCRLEENLMSVTNFHLNLVKQEASFEKRKYRFEFIFFFGAFLIISLLYFFTSINVTDKEIRYISPPNTFIEKNN